MATSGLKFLDILDNTYIETYENEGTIVIISKDPDQGIGGSGIGVCIRLDKSTALKFANSLQTEISKIQD